jgi:hypothetical protein
MSRKNNICINIPSSQSFRSYLHRNEAINISELTRISGCFMLGHAVDYSRKSTFHYVCVVYKIRLFYSALALLMDYLNLLHVTLVSKECHT